DSTGVAHILEHTALCGSEKYPVRDPFFMMIRRSLNTFMNAFTSSDWTAYPFASQNKKDFNNLLDVYLDAVFFSNLHPLDFAQEGHRLEFAEPTNPDSELQYKGVVFNEMKGAMSSPVSTLHETLNRYLFPNSTYHFNSGGDPEHIVDLDYSQLLSFYRTHYHPSNAVFYTFGNIPAEEHMAHFEKVLSRFSPLEKTIQVEPEKRYHSPLKVEECYGLDAESEEELQNQTHIVFGWLMRLSNSLEDQLKGHILANALLDSSAAPLRYALETCGLGAGPSPLCGMDDSNLENTFMCGLEGTEPEHMQALEKIVFDVLQDVAENGVPHERLEAILHQLELSQREIGGDSYPYGLQLILSSLSHSIHRSDALAALDIDAILIKLREEIKNPAFIKDLVKEQLLDNPHQVRLTLKPDAQLNQRREIAEKMRLEKIKAELTESQKAAIVEQAKALLERQNRLDDESILPKVGLEDIPHEFEIPEGQSKVQNGLRLCRYDAGTNGLVYQQVVCDLPALDANQLSVLPYFSQFIPELGAGPHDYLQIQSLQTAYTGGISSFNSMRGATNDEQNVSGHFALSGKALARNHAKLNELMQLHFENARFDELKHIRELIQQQRARAEQSVTQNGHALAMLAASSGLSPLTALNHRISGLAGIAALKALDDSLHDEAALKSLAERFGAIHQQIKASQKQFLLIGENEKLDEYEETVWQTWKAHNINAGTEHFALPAIRQTAKQGWITSTQVNFCAKAYPTVPVDHPDAAALTVLGGFLRNGFLHRAIREQGGAYGGGASHDSNTASFRFYSYRDPRLSATLDDFDRAVDWMLSTRHEALKLEEAILGVIGDIDKPGSPAGEAKAAFHNSLYGRTPAQRREFRSRVLNVTLADLDRVTRTYLTPANASVAVVTQANQRAHLEALDLSIFHL
ncbi:MAG TPA: insulinase family protein, partial [Pseudomonadales bacterium]|nr:insulinase family protein [Pseudomonadales bacterium]